MEGCEDLANDKDWRIIMAVIVEEGWMKNEEEKIENESRYATCLGPIDTFPC